ncbi:hypothetical protein XENOCAPTIV_008362 [Xenoophorus captivus]|uniref:Uncharacterized protein n=1 Tax=Xenoophorus captivus TaxID=1517983 RepID=A0ABV0RUE2_9TELE
MSRVLLTPYCFISALLSPLVTPFVRPLWCRGVMSGARSSLYIALLLPSSGDHFTVPAKVQELAESLQHISGQLNSVLGALGSLAQRENSSLSSPFSMPQRFGTEAWGPAPTSAPVIPQMYGLAPSSLAPPPAPERLSEPLWSWAPQSSSAATPLFSTPISSGLTTSGDFMNSRWSQIFPGRSTPPPDRCSLAIELLLLRADWFSWAWTTTTRSESITTDNITHGSVEPGALMTP